MKGRVMAFAITCLFSISSAYSPEELRNFFEWGEYEQLIDSLEPHLTITPCMLDSQRCARYHSYLGVAYFGKGRLGDARKQFLRAFSYDTAAVLDSNYISEEIKELFIAARSDFFEQQARFRTEDSLRIAERRAFTANVQVIRREELRKSRRAASLMAASFITFGAAIASIAAYEYYSTKEPYRDFKAAAKEGDKLAYDRLRHTIRRVNGVIIGCAIAAGLSETAGIVFTFRSMRAR